jgi:hypothetical protein
METMETVVTQKTVVTTKVRRVPHPGGGGEATAEAVPAELIAGGEEDLDLKPERVQEWLQAWPAWKLTATGKMIHRVRAFPTSEVAAHYGAFVTGLAGALALPVQVNIAEGQVKLSLYAGRRQGRLAPLTEAVLAFATQLG